MHTTPHRLLGSFLLLLFAAPAHAAATYDESAAAFRRTLDEWVRADTTNPPGNEARIVALAAKRLRAEGIAFQTAEFAPGRESLVARLKGDGGRKPLLLLAHIDVVGTRDQKWSTDPHRLTEKDGFLYGRGVLDDLGMAAAELETVIRLKREGTRLERDVILALTGDEESGGLGVRTLLEQHPDWLDAEIALNEGATIGLGKDGKVKLVGLQVAEKAYADFTLTARGATGHSSVPVKDNAIYRLARALQRLDAQRMPAHLIPVTRAYLARRASLESGPLAEAMRHISASRGRVLAGKRLATLEKNPTLSASLRTTCVATLVSGGTKENALPPEARANVNCRILPDETLDSVRKRLVAAVADAGVEIRVAKDLGVGAGASPTDGEVPRAVEKIAGQLWPGAPVVPTLSRGATDSRFLRMRGIAAYGIHPIAIGEEDERRAHGIDERIPVSSVRPGLEFLHRLVLELAGA